MAQYLPKLPNTITDPAVKDLLERYYDASNQKEMHDDFTDLFTEDGEYNMNNKINKGRDQILSFRKAIYAHIPVREHYARHIFTAGDNQMEIMAFGDVGYKHHMGHETGTNWAAKYELKKEKSGQVKFASCHIVVDSAQHV